MRPTDADLEDQLNIAYDSTDSGGSIWPGMSYEDGVIATIRWVLEEEPFPPMEDQ